MFSVDFCLCFGVPVCVCVFFPFILDMKFVGPTSRGHTDRRKATQDFSSTFLLRCVPLLFSREGFSHSFPSSTVKSNFVCVCVCVFSSYSFWTSSSLDVPAGVTQEEGHTGFFIHLLSAVRALIFLARRIQPFISLADREVEFCVLTTLNSIMVR